MIKFETFLIEKGYLKFAFNGKEMKYYKPKEHIVSTMLNLGHCYIHNSDTNLLNKIEQGKSVMEKDFTWEDRKGEIFIGLHEKDKPVTLISPRPRIEIKRLIDNKVVVFNEWYDDEMNVVLSKIDFEDILKAMYNKEIILKIDLTNGNNN